MAKKISELNYLLGAGARTNKYRVIFPYFGKEFDIQVHEVTAPGAGIGVVDVYLKGREYKIAGDRGDTGEITLSFYNDPNLIIRNFFLRYIQNIQDYHTPDTINLETITDYTSIISSIGFNFVDNLLGAANGLIDYYNQIKYNLLNIKGFVSGITGNELMPFYQTDIVIQQLNGDEDVVSETVYYNAFISNVSELQYSDETGDISKTSLTINYSGFKIRDHKIN
jgi:hypothetical protein